jgi:hypothetical protein
MLKLAVQDALGAALSIESADGRAGRRPILAVHDRETLITRRKRACSITNHLTLAQFKHY